MTEGPKLRVGLVVPPLPCPHREGLELAVDGLAKGLSSRGHDVVLLTIVDPLRTKQWAMQFGLAARTIHQETALGKELGDCDIVHDHTLAALFVRNVHHRAAVVTTNYGPFDADPIPMYRRRADDHVPMIALSCDQASRAPKSVTVSTVIHPGIDISMYRYRPLGSDYFVVTGPMHEDGGIVEAIEIASATDAALMIYSKVEEPDEHDYFHEHVRPHLGPTIQFHAELALRDRSDLLGGAKALLHPVKWCEPFAMTIVEAMACGTPTIAFAGGAAEEIFEHGVTGYIGSSMSELIAAAGRIESINRDHCRQRAERFFDCDEVAGHHEDFYREVIDDQAAERSCEQIVRLAANSGSPSSPTDIGPLGDSSPGNGSLADSDSETEPEPAELFVSRPPVIPPDNWSAYF